MNLNRRTLELASQQLRKLELKLNEEKQSGAERLAKEYRNLVKGLVAQKVIKSESEMYQAQYLGKGTAECNKLGTAAC